MAQNSPTLLAEEIATRNVTFTERRDIEHDASSLKGGFVSMDRVRLRTHRGVMG